MKIIRQIQYQVAKLEVLESLLQLTRREQVGGEMPSLEVELAQGVLTTLRQSLYDACEGCLDCPQEKLNFYQTRLTSTLISAQAYLSQVVNQLGSQEPQILFFKEVIVGVISEILNLSRSLVTSPELPPESSPETFPEELTYPQPATATLPLGPEQSLSSTALSLPAMQLALTPVVMMGDLAPRPIELELEIVC